MSRLLFYCKWRAVINVNGAQHAQIIFIRAEILTTSMDVMTLSENEI